jgi:hypothetical protein
MKHLHICIITFNKIMKAIIEDLNSKTDNRFVYAIGIFCLLSICLSQFPKTKKNPIIVKTQITMASKLGNNIDIGHLPSYQ